MGGCSRIWICDGDEGWSEVLEWSYLELELEFEFGLMLVQDNFVE